MHSGHEDNRSWFGKVGLGVAVSPFVFRVPPVLRVLPEPFRDALATGLHLLLISAPAVGLVLCLMGCKRDSRKIYAIIGLCAVGLYVLILLAVGLFAGALFSFICLFR